MACSMGPGIGLAGPGQVTCYAGISMMEKLLKRVFLLAAATVSELHVLSFKPVLYAGNLMALK